jgi:hypothetical protein
MYWAIRSHLASQAGKSGFEVVVTRFGDFAQAEQRSQQTPSKLTGCASRRAESARMNSDRQTTHSNSVTRRRAAASGLVKSVRKTVRVPKKRLA